MEKSQREAFLIPFERTSSGINVNNKFQEPCTTKVGGGATVTNGVSVPNPRLTDLAGRRTVSGSGKRTADTAELLSSTIAGSKEAKSRGETKSLCISAVKSLLNMGKPCRFFNTARGCFYEHFVVQSEGQRSSREITSLREKVNDLRGDNLRDKTAMLEKINTLHATI